MKFLLSELTFPYPEDRRPDCKYGVINNSHEIFDFLLRIFFIDELFDFLACVAGQMRFDFYTIIMGYYYDYYSPVNSYYLITWYRAFISEVLRYLL